MDFTKLEFEETVEILEFIKEQEEIRETQKIIKRKKNKNLSGQVKHLELCNHLGGTRSCAIIRYLFNMRMKETK